MIRMRRRRAGKIILAVAACCGTLVPGLTACAQPVTERTPNVQGTWVTSPWTVYFQFAHRFEVVGDATIGDIFTDGKVVNYPTFELDFGFPFGTMVGVRYSSNSLVQSNFNEWQPYVKWAPIRGVGDGSFSLSYLGAYNGASKSFDSELSSQTRFGPVQILGAVRGFTNPYEVPDSVSSASLALAGGLGFKINRYLQLGGDVGGIVAGLDGIPVAWSGQLGIGIPFTPHTFSIVATNVASGTLEGVSSGVSGAVFWGFIPPGTTVGWVIKDPLVHTASWDDGVWESPSRAPGERFSVRFEEAGEYAYHCIPHPFMKARVIVTGGEEGAASQP
ncbi:MAG: plastocyanin/azurin family copper-binding protein [Gemmatimonadales bacterium]